MQQGLLSRIALGSILSSVLVSALLFNFRKAEQSLFPLAPAMQLKLYNDSSDGGNSRIHLLADAKKSISFVDTLDAEVLYPYAGIAIGPKAADNYMDISAYESLVIRIKAKHSKIVPITIRVFCDGFSNPSNPNSYMAFVYSIEDSVIDGVYEIPLEKFVVPEWWYGDNGIENGSGLHPSFSKVQSFNIEHSSAGKMHWSDEVTLSALTLSRYNYYYLYVLVAGILFGCFLLLYVYLTRKKMIFIPYQSTAEHTGSVDTEQKILDYIAANYANPALGLALIQREIGISDARISAVVKEKYQQSFKQYLNNLRMTEAKRLLLNTGVSISEIAYVVGYSNVSHFNRVFKAENGVAPGDFRKAKT